jgi:uncharacterized membrane protein HdeD (DUF308 family)
VPRTISQRPSSGQLAEDFRRLSRRWWLFLALGVVAVAIGTLLVVDVFTAVRTLALLVGLGLLSTGVLDLLSVEHFHPRWTGFLSGALLTGAGVLAIAWPGVTLLVVAVLAGVGLLIGGALRTMAALAVRDMPGWWLLLLGGVLSLVAGAVALVWPEVTILVLGVLLGLRTLMFGVTEIAFALALRQLALGPSPR